MSTFESFGKYILLEKLATGGMAEVFLARGSGAGGIGKFFAIKRILPQYADSPEFIEMFKDEAKIAINLSHSNIVSIHEFGVEKGQFFLVMDYVEGRNLRQILNKMKKSGLQFTIDQIVYVIKEVCAGLDHAHRCIDGSTGKPLNITHRDMSPQNLMVSFEGEVKIVDFGIAKAESQIETTRAGTLKGKFGYMSPEQAEGQPVDLRTDIFSLGIVMWELLASDRLFVANNEINTLRKIRDCQIPALRKINPNIHAELERISQKALARDRNLRYQTGAALHRDLNRFLNRQYPDFSPQDFAVFIKSVFSDEIMALRKRLVEYSKINLSNNVAAGKAFDDRTSLLDTNTNSLVLSQSDVDVSVKIQRAPKARPVNEIEEVSEVVPTEAPTGAGPAFKGQGTAGGPLEESNSFVINESTNTDAGAPLPPTTASKSDRPVGFDGNPVGLPPLAKPGMQTPVLNEQALEALREVSVNKRNPHFDTEDVSSPSIPSIHSRSQSYNTRALRHSEPIYHNSSSARFATLMIFLAVCIGGYAYLVKNQTAMMQEVLTVTDPYLHPVHVALGVPFPPVVTNLSSHDRSPQNPEPSYPSPASPADPTATEVASPSGATIISNPSGAEILLNDRPTGLFTPSPLEMPTGKFDLTLRKHGYKDYSLRDLTRESVGHRLVASLIKQNVAYLDINVFPPQEAVIYVNGKKLEPQPGGFHEVPVSANQNIKIRAETRMGQSYDEITVNLPVDRRQRIQLNPRKTLRLPSSSPNQ